MVDLLNFSFWSDRDEPFAVDYEGVQYTGYWSLCAAINRAIDEGIPVTEASWWVSASDDEFEYIFRSDTIGKIPLLKERIRLLRDHGAILLAKFGGAFVNVISAADGDAVKLLNLVTCNFYSFMDVSTFQGDTVFILKRAQILVADLWACFEGKSYGKFTNIGCITMFADYRIPQQLELLGLLHRSDILTERMREGELLNVHSEEVLELRGCSIWIVELLRREMVKLDDTTLINAILIDFYLWDTIKDNKDKLGEIPIHRTRSFYY